MPIGGWKAAGTCPVVVVYMAGRRDGGPPCTCAWPPMYPYPSTCRAAAFMPQADRICDQHHVVFSFLSPASSG